MQVALSERGLGRVDGDEFVLLDTTYPDAGAVIADTGSLRVLDACRAVSRRPLTDVRLRAPLAGARALWGVGLNYASKAAQSGRALPEQPILYLAASASVPPADAAVALPDGVTEPDYEGEIAVVVGRRLYRVAPADVWPTIAAVTAANDMTARDVMRATATPALAKSFPGFTPLGPSLGAPDEFADRDDIPLRTSVNGVPRQDDTSAGMIFPVDELLSRLSWFAALEPGDVVLTGTPAGTGQDRSVFLAPGDEVRVDVGGLLPLVTRYVAAGAASVRRELAQPA